MKPSFDDMEYGVIIGIIDSNDAVHSVFYDYDDRESASTHESIFPMQNHKKWRWGFDSGIDKSIYSEHRFTVEDYDRIRSHITRKYGIKFRGISLHHDITHFISKLKKD